MRLLLIVTSLLLYLNQEVTSSPAGMPNTPELCLSMTPQHRSNSPRLLPPPFDIIVSQDSYRANDNIEVTLKMRGTEKFKGFSIQARRVGANTNTDQPVGFFKVIPGTKEICNHPTSPGATVIGNGLTHTNDSTGSKSPKSSLTLTWNPRGSHGHIEFRVTVVISFDRYWVAESSRIVRDVLDTSPLPTPVKSSSLSSSDRIRTEDCGRTKGCYRNPSGCESATCELLVSWRNLDDYIEFELVADTEGWVAVGLSDDLKMGNEDVYECIANSSSAEPNRPVAGQSRNGKTGKNNYVLPQATSVETRGGQVDRGRLSCTFRVLKRDENSLITARYHLLMAKGRTDEHGRKLPHTLEPFKPPYVSVNKVSLADTVDISGTTRYILVKVHGCLMLIGWMICSSTALILAKYYKSMWPNKRICDERVWFAVHRGCMVVNLFATVTGFIIIFIHANGYSQMTELPGKAHPILGVITTVLCIINPFIALFRCGDHSDKRPIFNWIHWFIGTCAAVLATPTMFIGLNLHKAHVPWWSTWIMVAFFIFHLVIELLLEIHGCLNASKEKFQRQNYELRKSKGDSEPEPVGRRFKKIVLAIYLVVVISLGFIMVISVAAG